MFRLSFSKKFFFNKSSFNYLINNCTVSRCYTNSSPISTEQKFETVFTLPSVRYMSIISRLKLYHFFGASIAVPGTGILAMLNVISNETFLSAAYIGVTGAAVLTIASLPFRNVIGFLYISEDNKWIKISSIDFWGKRTDKIISTEEWIPILEMPPKVTDAIFLSPQLADGTKYKLLLKYGISLNPQKMGQVLE